MKKTLLLLILAMVGFFAASTYAGSSFEGGEGEMEEALIGRDGGEVDFLFQDDGEGEEEEEEEEEDGDGDVLVQGSALESQKETGTDEDKDGDDDEERDDSKSGSSVEEEEEDSQRRRRRRRKGIRWVKRRPRNCRISMHDPRICTSRRGRVFFFRNRRAVYRRGRWFKSKGSKFIYVRGKWTVGRVRSWGRKPPGCRDSKTNPQICRLNGKSYKYRYRKAVRRGGQWFRSRNSRYVYKRGRWVKAKRVRHPTDPRYVRIGSRWIRRSAKKIAKYVKVYGLWWKSNKHQKYWYRARWNKPAAALPQNDPHYRRTRNSNGKYTYVRHLKKSNYVIWEGIWIRRVGSQSGYWNGRWRPLKKIIANDPNFQRNKNGRWRNMSLRRPRGYYLRYGRWFRSRKSPYVFNNRRWVDYRKLYENNPLWVFTRKGRWIRVAGSAAAPTTAAGPSIAGPVAFKKRRGLYWRGNRVFYHRKWISGRRFKQLRRTRTEVKRLRDGEITPDMRAAVKAQVYTNFSRFIKWFISNYLRGGQNLARRHLARDLAAQVKDKYMPEPKPRDRDPSLFGTSKRSAVTASSFIIDGRVRKSAKRRQNHNRYRNLRNRLRNDPLKSTITYAERNQLNTGPRRTPSFLATSASEQLAAEQEDAQVGNNDEAVGESGASSDPSLPDALNGNNLASSERQTSSDPSLAPQDD